MKLTHLMLSKRLESGFTEVECFTILYMVTTRKTRLSCQNIQSMVSGPHSFAFNFLESPHLHLIIRMTCLSKATDTFHIPKTDAFTQGCFLRQAAEKRREVKAAAGPTWDLNSQPHDYCAISSAVGPRRAGNGLCWLWRVTFWNEKLSITLSIASHAERRHVKALQWITSVGNSQEFGHVSRLGKARAPLSTQAVIKYPNSIPCVWNIPKLLMWLMEQGSKS